MEKGVNVRGMSRSFLILLFLLCGIAPAAAQTPVSGDFSDRMIVTLYRDPPTAGEAADRELTRLAQLGRSASASERAAAHWVAAQAAFRLGDAEAVERHLRAGEALSLPAGQRARMQARAAFLRGLAARGNGDFATVLPLLQRAQRGFIVAGDVRGQAQALQALGMVYNDVGDGESGLRFFRLAEDTYQGDDLFLLSLTNNIGVAHQNSLNFAESVTYFSRARDLADRVGDTTRARQFRINIASSQLLLERYDDARKTLAELGSEERIDNPQQRADALRMLALIALHQGRVEQAKHQIERALNGVDPTATDVSYFEIHIAAYKIYHALGRDDLALVHLEAVRRLDAERAQVNASNRAALLGAQFRFDSQEARIAGMRAQQAARDAAYQRNISIAISIASLIVLALLAWLLRLSIRSRNRARADAARLTVLNEQLASALAAKSAFLASTSHEIRTPLNGILGMAQIMLADTSLPERLRSQIELVHDAGTTMRALVDDILDVAKIEHGGFVINPRPTNVPELVGRVTRLYEAQAESRGIALCTDIASDLMGQQLDSDRLTQILFNLVGNALKFTQQGSITVRVHRAHAEQGEQLLIDVADTGIGIAPEWQEAVFDMFQQVDNGRTRNYGGTGLGLAICRQLAEAMGGGILLESEEGKGSTFTVRLPWRPVEETVAPSQSSTTDSQGASRPLAIVAGDPLRVAKLTVIVRQTGREPIAVSSSDQYERVIDGDWLVDGQSLDKFCCWAATRAPGHARVMIIGDVPPDFAQPIWLDAIVTRGQFTRNSVCAVLAEWSGDPASQKRDVAAGEGEVGKSPVRPDDPLAGKIASTGG